MNNLIDGYEVIFKSFVLLLSIGFVGTLLITVSMANKRGRNQVIWFILAIIFPIYAMFALFFLGETDEKREERIIEEEQWRRMMRD